MWKKIIQSQVLDRSSLPIVDLHKEKGCMESINSMENISKSSLDNFSKSCVENISGSRVCRISALLELANEE